MTNPQRAVRTQAIILRHRDLGEADRILTILTPHNGKLDVVAHGARKPTSRKTGHVEIFSRVDMLLNLRRELGTVTQAELVEPFLALREDLMLGAYASYTVELLNRITEVGDDDLTSDLFMLLDATLARLCNEPDPRLVLRYFEIQLLEQVGFRPELHTCVVTGEGIRPENQYFSVAEGGVVSPEAGMHNPNYTPITLRALKVMRHSQRSPYKQVGSLKVDDKLHNELETILLGYITYTLESHLQSVDFIRRVRQFSR